jgi:hypothetical protein
MNRRRGLLATLGWVAASGGSSALAQTPPPPRIGEMKPLGGDRFQIGTIVVDKRARKFTVPGRVHVLGKPLEYLAMAPAGMKGYETLFEVDTTGSEFNLACILVGLERDPKLVQLTRAVRTPLAGQRIAISIAWSEGGRRRQVSAAEAILNPEAGVKPETVEWVYTGAPASDSGTGFMPDLTGTLIGFVRDANCIIESALGIGIGAYGSVRGSAIVPPVGTAIELIVDAAPVPR